MDNDKKKYKKAESEYTQRTREELKQNDDVREILLQTLPELGLKWDVHLPLFLTAPSLARLLWLNEVYQQSLNVPGHLLEFGSQWGSSLNIFLLLKMIYEPWNISRKILSFSTFERGFVELTDDEMKTLSIGDYGVKTGWEEQLKGILNVHAMRSPIGAENNFEVFEGDVCQTLPLWLQENPEALISHAHFDMDVYKPTVESLKLILPRMPGGGILIFDELNCPSFPGETQAVMEVLGIHGLKLKKSQYQPYSCYCVVE